MNTQICWTNVPPPLEVPIDSAASRYGLVAGLRLEEKCGGQYRCSICRQMKKEGTPLVWVPDGVLPHDPAWSISEKCRRGARNGTRSGWCLSCAKKLGAKSLVQRFLNWIRSEVE